MSTYKFKKFIKRLCDFRLKFPSLANKLFESFRQNSKGRRVRTFPFNAILNIYTIYENANDLNWKC